MTNLQIPRLYALDLIEESAFLVVIPGGYRARRPYYLKGML